MSDYIVKVTATDGHVVMLGAWTLMGFILWVYGCWKILSESWNKFMSKHSMAIRRISCTLTRHKWNDKGHGGHGFTGKEKGWTQYYKCDRCYEFTSKRITKMHL